MMAHELPESSAAAAAAAIIATLAVASVRLWQNKVQENNAPLGNDCAGLASTQRSGVISA